MNLLSKNSDIEPVSLISKALFHLNKIEQMNKTEPIALKYFSKISILWIFFDKML